MLLYSARGLNVYRDGLGYRFTVAVKDSSVKLTPRETQELIAALSGDVLALLGERITDVVDAVRGKPPRRGKGK
jgi:hypothetical protein